ncbi:hydroxyacylglutathione hydrolase [Marinicella rhabdoformis]|uniref:hydroxyacylglutathione hydrolase n=1 Tax=Marinicella rhabdoformis TaxID=2580566 RepID=UPI0012AEC47D|nr:hydroxyacylglutathione hydrolase [Marinicella rhabdoformis]
MKIKIHPIPAFSDNYIWTLQNQSHAVVVDPGDATAVTSYLNNHNLNLAAILITHHHYDHVDGLVELQTQWDCPVFAPKDERIPGNLTVVSDKASVKIEQLKLKFKVLFTPGHTLTHICYLNKDMLFCGDTLFSLGCGRMFEGTAEQFSSSLNQLKQLNDDTKVYCTHEYTESNWRFAQEVNPKNQKLNTFKTLLDEKRKQGLPSLPSTMAVEKSLNPFLNCSDPTIVSAVSGHFNQQPNTASETFALLRHWKDNF